MDLRVQKTLENIEKEFLTLRAKTPLNKIKVNDLCENAKINKSTFYRYYTDVFDLSDKAENETIDRIMESFTTIDCLFTNPEEFISGLLAAIGQHDQKILTLFGGRINIFADKIEARLKRHYLSSPCPLEDDMMMSFLIGGATHVFLNPTYDIEAGTKTLAAFLRKIPVNGFLS
ncbi:MAG: TetR/AcrR family transcriptional regulator [Clostridiales bacterium]|jgi:AcrR family transcriptional regulator|nr:TetR/AcrR family transcriptional regulator [Clostridiales bacterium]